MKEVDGIGWVRQLGQSMRRRTGLFLLCLGAGTFLLTRADPAQAERANVAGRLRCRIVHHDGRSSLMEASEALNSRLTRREKEVRTQERR